MRKHHILGGFCFVATALIISGVWLAQPIRRVVASSKLSKSSVTITRSHDDAIESRVHRNRGALRNVAQELDCKFDRVALQELADKSAQETRSTIIGLLPISLTHSERDKILYAINHVGVPYTIIEIDGKFAVLSNNGHPASAQDELRFRAAMHDGTVTSLPPDCISSEGKLLLRVLARDECQASANAKIVTDRPPSE